MSASERKRQWRRELKEQWKTIFGNRRYWLHVGIWMVALFYVNYKGLSTFDSGFSVGVNASEPPSADIRVIKGRGLNVWIVSFLCCLWGALVAYVFLLLVVPYSRYRQQKRYLWIGVLSVIFLWTAVLVSVAIFVASRYKGRDSDIFHHGLGSLMVSLAFSLMTSGLFFSFYYFLDLYDQQKGLNRYREALTEKLAAETSFLKTQINPHFLFNSLNNIYSLTLSDPPKAAAITRQLKELISYMLYDCSHDRVPLKDEITFLQNYIRLEKLRAREDQVDIRFEVNGRPEEKDIAPLLLVNFVENAFKHGVKAGIGQAYVHLKIDLSGDHLIMDIINSRPPDKDKGRAIKEHGGIGMVNVRRRLAIFYPSRYRLKVKRNVKQYRVVLDLTL